MKQQVSFVTELSRKYNLPPQVIEVVCNHPFLFANRRMTEGDRKPLMFTYLGKIKMKKKYAQIDYQTKEDSK